jgi:hypothetical protein
MMKTISITILIIIFLSGCQQAAKQTEIGVDKPKPVISKKQPLEDLLLEAEKKAAPHGRKTLETGRQMTLIDREIIRGGCWDYANEVYNRSGFTTKHRKTVYKTDKTGPYANAELIQPGDWLYYLNHWYGKIEHSAIFIAWIDYENKEGLMLSYGGEKRREPARYMSYDLTNVYCIIRPRTLSN